MQRLIKKSRDAWINIRNGLGDDGFAHGSLSVVKPVSPMQPEAVDNLWRSSHACRIGITEQPEEALRKGYEIRSKSVDDLHEVCDEWALDFGLDNIVLEAWNMARAHGGAWLMLVTNDIEDPTELHLPLDLSKRFHLQNIVIASRREVNPTGEYITRPSNRRFREAQFYNVNLISKGTHASYMRVHHSRMLYIPGRQTSYLTRIANNGYDDSVLQDMEQAIQDQWSGARNIAELLYKAQILFLKTTPKQATALNTEDGKRSIKERMRHMFEAMTTLGLPVIFDKEDILQKVASFANLDKIYDKQNEEVACGFRMPMTRYKGQAPGGFNTDGSSQQANWYSIVASSQTREIGPVLKQLWDVVLRALDGPTKGKYPEDWKLVWAPLDEPTETMKVELLSKTVDILLALKEGGLIGEEEARAVLAENEMFASHLDASKSLEPPDDETQDATTQTQGPVSMAQAANKNT